MLSTFFKWVVFSSKDSSKISLAVKGFLMALIPVLTTALGLVGIQFDSETATMVVDAIVVTINTIFITVSAVSIAIGSWRKVRLTWRGENHVLNTLDEQK